MTNKLNRSRRLSVVLLDNYDSFSYNVVELLRSHPIDLHILKNDDPELLHTSYDAMIISPGPGLPSESALLNTAIQFHYKRIPILGICLGLQAIVEFYGGGLKQLPQVYHGIRDRVKLLDERSESPLFKNIPPTFFAGRYHSWVGAQNSFPSELSILAVGSDGEIMAIENTTDKIYAVQFHPESYMTTYGDVMIQNFINLSVHHKSISHAF